MSLPPELMLVVANVLADQHAMLSLATLACASHALSTLVAPTLYKTVLIVRDAEATALSYALSNAALGSFVRTLAWPHESDATSLTRVLERCPHITALRCVLQYPVSDFLVTSTLPRLFLHDISHPELHRTLSGSALGAALEELHIDCFDSYLVPSPETINALPNLAQFSVVIRAYRWFWRRPHEDTLPDLLYALAVRPMLCRARLVFAPAEDAAWLSYSSLIADERDPRITLALADDVAQDCHLQHLRGEQSLWDLGTPIEQESL